MQEVSVMCLANISNQVRKYDKPCDTLPFKEPKIVPVTHSLELKLIVGFLTSRRERVNSVSNMGILP